MKLFLKIQLVNTWGALAAPTQAQAVQVVRYLFATVIGNRSVNEHTRWSLNLDQALGQAPTPEPGLQAVLVERCTAYTRTQPADPWVIVSYDTEVVCQLKSGVWLKARITDRAGCSVGAQGLIQQFIDAGTFIDLQALLNHPGSSEWVLYTHDTSTMATISDPKVATSMAKEDLLIVLSVSRDPVEVLFPKQCSNEPEDGGFPVHVPAHLAATMGELPESWTPFRKSCYLLSRVVADSTSSIIEEPAAQAFAAHLVKALRGHSLYDMSPATATIADLQNQLEASKKLHLPDHIVQSIRNMNLLYFQGDFGPDFVKCPHCRATLELRHAQRNTSVLFNDLEHTAGCLGAWVRSL